jgi:hypothetical protein
MRFKGVIGAMQQAGSNGNLDSYSGREQLQLFRLRFQLSRQEFEDSGEN